MTARGPFDPREMYPVWLAARAGHGVRWVLNALALRFWREREWRRSALRAQCFEMPDIGRTQAAIAGINGFLADPPGPAASWVAAQGTAPGLSGPHIGPVLHAQAHAAAGRYGAAALAMAEALAVLERDDPPPEPLPGWFASGEAAGRTAAEERARQSRAELAALARAFIAGANARDGASPEDGVALIDEACRSQPAFAYLHSIQAQVLDSAGQHAGAYDALGRHVALLGGVASLAAREGTAQQAAVYALRAVQSGGDGDAGLLDRAERRLLDLRAAHDGETEHADMDEGTASRRAAFLFWLMRLVLRRAELELDGGRPVAAAALLREARTLGEAIPRSAGVAARETSDHARDWIASVHSRMELDPGGTGALSWARVAGALRAAPADAMEATLLQRAADRIATGRMGAGLPPEASRLRVEFPPALLADVDDEAQLQRLTGSGDAPEVPSLSALRAQVLARYRLTLPAVLFQPLRDESSDTLRVILDGVPIATGSIPMVPFRKVPASLVLAAGAVAPGGALPWASAPDWFGRAVFIPRDGPAVPGAARTLPADLSIVVFLAAALSRSLELLASGHAASAFGLEGGERREWWAVIGMLLADRTPLTDGAELRRCVEPVRRGTLSPLEASALYRRRARVSLWGAGTAYRDVTLSDGTIDALRRELRPGAGSATLGHAVTRAVEREVREALEAGGGRPARLVVGDAALRPWVRLALRRALPDVPVLSADELDRGA